MAVVNLKEAALDLAGQIEALGVPCAVDPRDMELPSALLDVGPIVFDALDADSYSVTWDLYLIARNNGPEEALDVLGDMLAKLRVPFKLPGADPLTLTLPNHGADPMPALVVRLETRVTPSEE